MRLTLALVLLSLSACTGSTDQEEQAPKTIAIEILSVERSLLCPDQKDTCLWVSIQYPEIKSPTPPSLANEVHQAVLELTYDGDTTPHTFQQLADRIIQDYQSVQEENPEFVNRWNIDQTVETYLNNEQLLGLLVNNYSYTGGAHGNYFQAGLLFETDPVRLLELDNLLTEEGKEQLTGIVEKEFRVEKGLSTDAKLEEAGFWFEDNIFKLSENFTYGPDSLRFIYNIYEIGPYAMGPTEIALPYEQVSTLVKEAYRFDQ